MYEMLTDILYCEPDVNVIHSNFTCVNLLTINFIGLV